MWLHAFLLHVLTCRGCQVDLQGYEVCCSFALPNIGWLVLALSMGTVLEPAPVKAHSFSQFWR